MQDALSRLLNTELTDKVERKLETNTGIIFLAWLVIMGTPAAFLGTMNTPWLLVYTFSIVIFLAITATLWYNYIRKGE